MSISKSQIQTIRQLHVRRNRIEEGLFLVEGTKIMLELLRTPKLIHILIATQQWLDTYADVVPMDNEDFDIWVAAPAEMERCSSLTTAQEVIAVVHTLEPKEELSSARGLVLVLEDIKDPGNLGTILRIADWYGVSNIILSEQSVDHFNPKVVQASMGSLFRVNVYRGNIVETLGKFQNWTTVGLALDGVGTWPPSWLEQAANAEQTTALLFGNESIGLSPAVAQLCQHSLRLNNFGRAESLNVGISVAVTLDRIKNKL